MLLVRRALALAPAHCTASTTHTDRKLVRQQPGFACGRASSHRAPERIFSRFSWNAAEMCEPWCVLHSFRQGTTRNARHSPPVAVQQNAGDADSCRSRNMQPRRGGGPAVAGHPSWCWFGAPSRRFWKKKLYLCGVGGREAQPSCSARERVAAVLDKTCDISMHIYRCAPRRRASSSRQKLCCMKRLTPHAFAQSQRRSMAEARNP